ncbi:MAG: hypothetical protein KGK08_14055 [Acidobacteriota bacterium]|nr:hypothetical protein [Acidobacteriota bacterium]
MRHIPSLRLVSLRFVSLRLVAIAIVLLGTPSLHAADVAGSTVDRVSKQVTTYLTNLADLLCRESVLQEKLTPNGHVDTFERSNYEYFILIDGDKDNLQLTESRVETSKTPRRPLPLLVTNGFSSLLLIFHPYYRDSFRFDAGAPEVIEGQSLVPIHFRQISNNRAPAALAVRGRQYTLELTGTAWADARTGQVFRMDASLANDMTDIGLRSLHVQVNYAPTSRGPSQPDLVLPTLAVVDVESRHQHWRNTHTFNSYKTFTATAEQDPNVTVHTPASEDKAGQAAPASTTPSKP